MFTEIPENPILGTPSNSNVFGGVFAVSNSQPALERSTTSLSLSSPLYLTNINSDHHQHQHYAAPSPVLVQPAAAMSATALLQKAAQMGAAASDPSLMLRGLGFATVASSSSSTTSSAAGHGQQYPNVIKSEMTAGIGLGLTPSSSLFGNQPTTLDLLGLGIGIGIGIGMGGDGLGAASNGLSALLTSFESGAGAPFDFGPASASATASYDHAGASDHQSTDRKPNSPAML